MADHPIIYTIMPDYAGAYGWVIADGDESQGVGPNHADTSGWYGEHPISRELHEEFAHWQDLFEAAPMLDDGTIELGWDNFHATGIDLARKLKTEIGDRARIIYEKPFEDPDREQDERREVLSDGSLLPLPSREDVYRVRLSRLVVKIVSGGQTGADRAALDWAISHGVPHGGWCPSGRVAEDGGNRHAVSAQRGHRRWLPAQDPFERRAQRRHPHPESRPVGRRHAGDEALGRKAEEALPRRTA
jgi:hypothetical protein